MCAIPILNHVMIRCKVPGQFLLAHVSIIIRNRLHKSTMRTVVRLSHLKWSCSVGSVSLTIILSTYRSWGDPSEK